MNKNNSFEIYEAPTSVAPNRWYHYMTSWSRKEGLHLFIDGVPVNTNVSTRNISSFSTRMLKVGKKVNDAWMRRFALWDRKLNEEESKALYEQEGEYLICFC